MRECLDKALEGGEVYIRRYGEAYRVIVVDESGIGEEGEGGSRRRGWRR